MLGVDLISFFPTVLVTGLPSSASWQDLKVSLVFLLPCIIAIE